MASVLRAYFETYGCQMNMADSDALASALAQAGYALTDDPAAADLIVVNTCSVRDHAEQRARGRIAELTNLKRKRGSDQQVWVVGCMAERLGESLRQEFPGVDRVIGAIEVETLSQHIGEYLGKREDATTFMQASSVTAHVPVVRGCDNYCAYCVVPYVRGREHSLPASAVESTVRHLVERGVKEVTLLGQNVNSYRDPEAGTDFPGLLRRIHQTPGLARVRFLTSHPKDCSEALIRSVAELPKLCKHIHLPVQSGSSAVLSRMNRGYTREQYLDVIGVIRRHMPQADITTDVMTGFPGETPRDFEDTLSLFRQTRFTAAFMFAFSPRPGTAAASFPDQVPAAVGRERLAELIALQTATTQEHYAAMVGREVNALITGRLPKRERPWIGQDHGCKRVLVACDGDLAGTILPLTVASATGMSLIAERGAPCAS